MVLSDVDLKAALDTGEIVISPAPDLSTQLGACSLDLRLGDEFRVFERARTAFIDPRNEIDWDSFTRLQTVGEGEPFIMHPQELVLASTIENITLPADILGRLEGRSSLGDSELSCTARPLCFSPVSPAALSWNWATSARCPSLCIPA
jgi:dCTP deaminase